MLRSVARPLPLALTLGLFAEILFDGPAPGVNLVLFVAALLLAAVVIRRPSGAGPDRLDLWLAPAALAFAGFAAVRADPTLVLFDGLVAAALSAAAIVALGGSGVTRRTIVALIGLGAWVGSIAAIGTGLLIERARPWVGLPTATSRAARAGGPVARGLVLALPLVAVFLFLFAAADAVFARLLSDLLDVSLDLGDLPERLAFLLLCTWFTGGYLALAVLRPEASPTPSDAAEPGALPAPSPAPGELWPEPGRPAATGRSGLGSTEAAVVLLALDALFAAFVAIQVAYLFGGRDTLAASGLTYSDYATRGFHELVAVAILAGVVILSLEAVVRRRSRLHVGSAVGLLVLTGVILLSAFLRLRLYQDAYGWTELRFYVFVAIVFLGLAIVTTGTLLLADRSRWAIHALGVGVLVVALGVNVVGPQTFVAGQNVARALDPSLIPVGGRTGLDAEYVLELGDDAIPTLAAALPRLSELERSTIEEALRRRAGELATDPALSGWPAWNLARAQARDSLAAALGR